MRHSTPVNSKLQQSAMMIFQKASYCGCILGRNGQLEYLGRGDGSHPTLRSLRRMLRTETTIERGFESSPLQDLNLRVMGHPGIALYSALRRHLFVSIRCNIIVQAFLFLCCHQTLLSDECKSTTRRCSTS